MGKYHEKATGFAVNKDWRNERLGANLSGYAIANQAWLIRHFMETIEARYAFIDGLPTAAFHKYIIYTNSNGNKFINVADGVHTPSGLGG